MSRMKKKYSQVFIFVKYTLTCSEKLAAISHDQVFRADRAMGPLRVDP